MKKILLLILSIFAICGVSAQVTTSGISGTVIDEQGQPLVGATVIAVHTPSGTQYGAVVNDKGSYRINNVRPGGPYTVKFSMIGYQSVDKTDLQIPLAENYVSNAFLKEDAIGMDAVVVSADGKGSSMNSNRSGAVTNINRDGIAITPSISRSMNDIMRMSPQASSTTSGFAVGGGNYRQSYVTVDGAAFNNSFGIGQNLPANGSPISLDALDQISVSVTPYDVRQSGFTGGSINAVTRSGSNNFFGTAYTYLKNNTLRGDKIGDTKIKLEKASTYTYGASLGGAIIKDKLFFFVNGEYEDELTAGPNGVPSTDGKFSGNVKRPTAADMNTMRDFLIDKYNYDPGRYANYSVKTPGYKIMARMDWNINDNHKLNVRFSRSHTKDSSNPSSSTSPLYAQAIYPGSPGDNEHGIPAIGSGQNRTSNYAMYFESSRYYTIRDFTSVAAELSSRWLDGRVINTVRYTYSYQNEPREVEGGMFPTVDILKDGACYMSFGPDPFTAGNIRKVSTHVITDEVNWRWGINNFVAGFQFEHNNATNGFMQGGSGYYVFDSMENFMNGSKPSAFGVTHSNSPDMSQFMANMTSQQYSVYLQDDIELHKNFKLSAGLRFEIPVYPSLENNYNEAYAKLDFGGTNYSTDQLPKSRLSVSPRVGFNWDITGERKYIMRGGTGYFVGRLPFVWLVSAVGNSNVGQTSFFYNTTKDYDGAQPNFHTNMSDILKDVYPNGFNPAIPTAPSSPTIIDKGLKMPAAWKTSLAFDIKLPGDIDLTIEGIYNKDYNPAVISNMNIKPSTETKEIVPGDNRSVVQEWVSPVSTGGKYNKQDCFYITNGGKDAYYYSVTAQLHKRFRFGLDLSFAYTHSKSRSYNDGIGDQVTSAYKTNTYSVGPINNHELGYGTYVAPDRILATIGYRKAYGKHFATTLGLVYEGSQLGFDGFYSYSRYSYTFSTNITGDGGANSLLYIPASREELDKWNFVETTIKPDGKTEVYTIDQQKEDFWDYINQDDYLRSRKGKYTERGGAIMPWHHQVDFKFAQEFFINTKKGNRNILEFGIDIQNLSNLLNSDWGLYKQVNNSGLLSVGTKKELVNGKLQDVFTGYFFSPANNKRNTQTFKSYENLWSTYRVMFSLRYKFN